MSLKELRSQLKAEDITLDETSKQIPLMSTMFTQSSGPSFDHGGSSRTRYASILDQGFAGTPSASLPFMPMTPMPLQGFQQVP